MQKVGGSVRARLTGAVSVLEPALVIFEVVFVWH